MAELYAQYDAWATDLGNRILVWAEPGYDAYLTQSWPLGRFSDAFAVALGYVAFVIIGSAVMKVVPIDLKNSKLIYGMSFGYNIIQMMLCSYMTLEAGILAYRNSYSVLPCNDANPEKPVFVDLLWLFYISKVLDFMDTVFIIIKRNWKQLSFLHVYHHFTIFLIYWLNVRVNYDGDIYLTIVLNGFIHAVMYTYYFVSLHTNKIWWKPALTMAQMIQFVCMITQASFTLARNCTACPRPVAWMYFYYIFTLLFLFAQFFVQSYMKPKKKKEEKKNQ